MTVTKTIYKNNDTVVGGMAKIADRITEGQPDGKKQSMEAMAAPCLKIWISRPLKPKEEKKQGLINSFAIDFVYSPDNFN